MTRRLVGTSFHRRFALGRLALARLALASLLAMAAVSAPVRAQPPGSDEDLPAVQLSGAGVEMLKLAVPRTEGDSASSEMMSKIGRASCRERV